MPDGGSALSLFCVFFCVSSPSRFYLLLLYLFFLFFFSFWWWLKVELPRWRWGGTEMAESQHSGYDNQCCCFPSSSQCCSRGEMAAAVLLLLLLYKDINWKPGGSCDVAPPPSLRRYQPLCFLFSFFFVLFFFSFSIRFCFFPLCHRSSPVFSLLKKLPLSPSFGFSSL